MDIEKNKLLDTQLVQSNEVANSNAMELEGLKRVLTTLNDNDIAVASIITDRHVQIRKFLREKHPEIHHWFDVWHLSKGVKKKIDLLSKRKDCEVLAEWSRAISNHLYWCVASSSGDGDMVEAKWRSIMRHIVDIHKDHAEIFPECLHGPIEPRKWLRQGLCSKYSGSSSLPSLRYHKHLW
ncbi:PREDICTED: uncharacterized protein LOC106818407 [Priapulus caudatus]|uniref:Uncharacterized protein LOC106818407 n=1 Tax=Priapulus caudatus TaxID=37621 RepID=A0ABM1F2D6_PRICU|nr:PREDICTED: uncharacterized protein LOC106818407 [Priapulus caudatus]